jgi:hypothetical protein
MSSFISRHIHALIVLLDKAGNLKLEWKAPYGLEEAVMKRIYAPRTPKERKILNWVRKQDDVALYREIARNKLKIECAFQLIVLVKPTVLRGEIRV